jgi:F-type H+-transporting ATPase subunit a
MHKSTLARFVIIQAITPIIDLVEQSTGKFNAHYYTFISSLFTFITACNWIALIPGVEEPTKSLNTTLALGLIAFVYIQKEVIKKIGFYSYIKEYFLPLNIMFPFNFLAGLIMLPLKLLGEVASVISISFRLFGNIFGGAIIGAIYQKAIHGSLLYNLLGFTLGVNFLITAFFILFEGVLQAFVFSILTLTNIALATMSHD